MSLSAIRMRVVLAGTMLVAGAIGALWAASLADQKGSSSAAAQVSRSIFGKSPRASQSVRGDFGHQPFVFEANQGQTDPRVKFMARGSGYGLFLTSDQAVLSLKRSRSTQKQQVIAMQLTGAHQDPAIRGVDLLPGKSNYLIGNDPAKWHRNVPQFARVQYGNVYPGIDLVYYGEQGQLEYDFVVAPGSNPDAIGWKFDGVKDLKVDAKGNLVLANEGEAVVFRAPSVYQQVGNEKTTVIGRFVLRAANEAGFEVGPYDRSRALIIDPVLTYSSYLGGAGGEGCFAITSIPTSGCPAIAVDPASNIYVAGTTTSTDFPSVTSPDPFQGSNAGGADVFVTKFNITGTVIQFSTYLGGTNDDTSAAIAVDSASNVYVTGTTASNTDFPIMAANAVQAGPMSAGNHVFASELLPDGTDLAYSTYLGGTGTDTATGLALDFHAKMYLTGTTTSTDLPVTANAFQETSRATNQFFIAKIDPVAADPTAANAYLSYLGGATPSTGTVSGGGIAVDTSSNVYVTGGTTFTDMGLNSSQAQAGGSDAFVGKFTLTNPATTQEVYLTYLGGTGEDIGYGVAVDTSFNAYITGSTTSTDVTTFTRDPEFSTSVVPFQPSNGGGTDAFVAKIGSAPPTDGTNYPLNYFSYLGGAGTDVGLGIAVDGSQGARLTGYTDSAAFHLAHEFQSTIGGGNDAFVARIDTTSTDPDSVAHFSSYHGGSGDDRGTGIAIDPLGNTYVSGETASTNFPVVGAFQGAISGSSDAFISKIGPTANFTMTVTASPTPAVGVGNPVTFTFTVTNTGDLASGVTFTDTLPAANATFVSATATGGSCGGATGTPPTVVCNLGTMNSNAVATITVIITPTAAPTSLSNSATLTVANSSFTVSSSASVTVNDYSISANPLSVTEPAGVPANYTLTLTPTGAIPNSIALSCSSGLPTGATCTFTTATITNLNNGAATSTVHINTTVRPTTTAVLQKAWPMYATWIPISGLALIGLGVRKKKRGLLSGVFLGAFFALVMFQAGCGSSSSTPAVTGGTPAGTYSVTMSGVSGSTSRTTTVTLIVQ
ncbi:MAG TPA: SBBP repeat-containing protein [Terriglobales bacterium]